MKQLVFQLPTQTDYTVGAFLPTAGTAAARAALNGLEASHVPHDLRGMVLVGPEGGGKTHLLTMWLAGKGPDCVAVDDAQTLDAAGQEVLFHTFNRVKERGGALVVASRVPVQELGLLADVTSRLATLQQVYIQPPDEAELAQLVVKWAADVQLTLTPAVVSYLLARAERSPAVLRALVTALDRLSLEERRGVTVPMAKRVLEEKGHDPSNEIESRQYSQAQ